MNNKKTNMIKNNRKKIYNFIQTKKLAQIVKKEKTNKKLYNKAHKKKKR